MSVSCARRDAVVSSYLSSHLGRGRFCFLFFCQTVRLSLHAVPNDSLHTILLLVSIHLLLILKSSLIAPLDQHQLFLMLLRPNLDI